MTSGIGNQFNTLDFIEQATKLEGSLGEDGQEKANTKYLKARIMQTKKRVPQRQTWDKTAVRILEHKGLTWSGAKFLTKN